MNPISLLNGDISTLKMATENLFEKWNDKVANDFKNHCAEQIQRDWNSYLGEMNTRMRIFMRAEKTVDDEIAKYEKEYKKK